MMERDVKKTIPKKSKRVVLSSDDESIIPVRAKPKKSKKVLLSSDEES